MSLHDSIPGRKHAISTFKTGAREEVHPSGDPRYAISDGGTRVRTSSTRDSPDFRYYGKN
eukprot:447349-Amphidinium_carterae.1